MTYAVVEPKRPYCKISVVKRCCAHTQHSR